ncbi:MAG: hypothetical protein IJN67_08400 [Oscillospiraceae bacterium]|nr:hypothetical protein [Oscillospiraceae bacterium]
MQSKTSCFNKAVFKKNLTRFAPVWGLYTICLIVGLFLIYTDGGAAHSFSRQFAFVKNMAELINVMGIINLGYALLAAELLFGDLFNSRMCNMLHAMPLRRESWFVTNVLSGLIFSLLPTFVMALIAMPLLNTTFYVDAWQIAVLWFLGTNLEYICFFGLAAFSAMCVGNRFTMAAGYGLLNAGAYIAYWLVDTIYTPMLYGIVTPTTLAENLTPVSQVMNHTFVETGTRSQLRELFGENYEGVTANFTVTDEWGVLLIWAAAGIVFLLAALWLYRKRQLECAGDAVAFQPLVPVFQVLCAIFVMAAGQFFLYSIIGLRNRNYPILAIGLVIGWFIGRMLIERSTRVFRLRNWYGLGALSAVLVLTLVCTHFDVLNLEEKMPKAERIEAVVLDTGYVNSITLEEVEDIETILQLHQYTLDNRAEEGSGAYVIGSNGQWVRYIDNNADLIDEEDKTQPVRMAVNISLRYELDNGNTVRREYNVWVDSPEGQILRNYLNRWENVTGEGQETVIVNGVEIDRMAMVLAYFTSMSVDYVPQEAGSAINTRQEVECFLAAVHADCAAGNMAQHNYFHEGYFRIPDADYDEGYAQRDRLWVYLNANDKYGLSLEVYPDCENTLRWLGEHDLLPEGMEILEGRRDFYY